MDDLNRKLALWAGFEIVEYISPDGSVAGRHWSAPDKISGGPTLPNFTASLDVCIQWLVPKLCKFSLDYDSLRYQETFQVDLAGIETTDNSPSLALCLAIEKLIDATPAPSSPGQTQGRPSAKGKAPGQ